MLGTKNAQINYGIIWVGTTNSLKKITGLFGLEQQTLKKIEFFAWNKKRLKKLQDYLGETTNSQNSYEIIFLEQQTLKKITGLFGLEQQTLKKLIICLEHWDYLV